MASRFGGVEAKRHRSPRERPPPLISSATMSVELPSDFFDRPLADVDPEIADVLGLELERQQRTLEMIASENFVPVSILECQGSVLTNKYAEGYPGRRYYGGCEYIDIAEQLAIDRAKALFGAEHANVQPHSGAQANAAAYQALMEPGDTLMGMELAHGGHLTHGMKINFSGRLYNIAAYQVDRESSRIDMELLLQRAETGRENQLRITVVFSSAGNDLNADASWRAVCTQIYCDLRAYLMGQTNALIDPVG